MRSRVIWRMVFGVYSVGMMVLLNWPRIRLPKFEILNELPGGADKFWHAMTFAGFTLLMIPARILPAKGWEPVVGAGLIVGGVSILSEIVQQAVPGRGFDYWDIVADLAGMAIVVVPWLYFRLRKGAGEVRNGASEAWRGRGLG